MNRDRIEGNWKQFKGNVQQHWSRFTGDRFGIVAGKRDQLAGTIQKSYGISRDEVKKQLYAWRKRQKDVAAPVLNANDRTHP